MNRDAIVTLNDLTTQDAMDAVSENLNKADAVDALDTMSRQYRRSLKDGGGSNNLRKMVTVIGDGIKARDLEAWLLENVA